MAATHHWPVWDKRVMEVLTNQRDMYKFMHDQTVRLINKGYTMLEIAAEFEKPGFLPAQFAEWYNRGYYGSISHDVRAIYQKYIGWYDMNPSNLNPLPPEAVAKEYVAAMGGEAAVAKLIDSAVGKNNLRWAAELGKHLVFANPSAANQNRLAAIYEKLGYACEAGTWRNMYLTGRAELTNGKPISPNGGTANPAMLTAMDDDMLFEFFACHLNADVAHYSGVFIEEEDNVDGGAFKVMVTHQKVLTWTLPKSSKNKQDALRHLIGALQFDRLIVKNRSVLVSLILKLKPLAQVISDQDATVISGISDTNIEAERRVSAFFDQFEMNDRPFNIVTP